MADLEIILWVPATIFIGGTVAMIAHDLVKGYRLSKQVENQTNQTKELYKRFDREIHEINGITNYLNQRRQKWEARKSKE